MRFNWVLQSIVVLLWALLVIGGEYFQMHGLVRVATCLLVFGTGMFLVVKSSALSSAVCAAEETMRQKGVWPWTSVQGWNSRTRDMFIQVIGWIFVIFSILGILGLIQVGG